MMNVMQRFFSSFVSHRMPKTHSEWWKMNYFYINVSCLWCIGAQFKRKAWFHTFYALGVFPLSMENLTKSACSSHALMTDFSQHAICKFIGSRHYWRTSTLTCSNSRPIAFRSAEGSGWYERAAQACEVNPGHHFPKQKKEHFLFRDLRPDSRNLHACYTLLYLSVI